MRIVALCFFISLLSLSVNAQQFTNTIKGKVIDKDSHQPLFGVNVLLVNSNPLRGASTDADGNFRIENVNVGRSSL